MIFSNMIYKHLLFKHEAYDSSQTNLGLHPDSVIDHLDDLGKSLDLHRTQLPHLWNGLILNC